MKKKLVLVLCVCMFGSVSMATGCSEKQEQKKEVTEEKKELKKIGEEKGSDYKVELKNHTGKKITGVRIKLIEDMEYPENMLKHGDIYENGESRELYYTTPKKSAGGEQGEKELTPGYDIQLTFEDNSVAELHSFPFEDIKKGEICLEEVAYIKYKSVSSKDEVATKEAELAIKAQKESEMKAAAEAEAVAKAAAEEAARKETEAQAAAEAARQAAEEEAARQAAEEAARAAERQNSSTQSSPEESSAGDGCVEDGLLW